MTLTEFLLARIAEDEEQARMASALSWVTCPECGYDPSRVLAECEAKRRIVEHAQQWAGTLHKTPEGWTPEACTAYRMAMEWAVQHLALPFADHPDYRDDEWRP